MVSFQSNADDVSKNANVYFYKVIVFYPKIHCLLHTDNYAV